MRDNNAIRTEHLRTKNGAVLLRGSAWAGIVAPFLFVAFVSVESLLRPGYSQISDYVSELGFGSNALLQNLNFILLGILSIWLAFGLEAILPPSGGNAVHRAKWLVEGFGLGAVFAGASLLLLEVLPVGYAFVAHTLSSFAAFILAVAAELAVWRALRDSDGVTWGRYRTFSLVSGSVSLFFLVVFSLTLNTAVQGATERLFLAVPLIWIVVTGVKLRSRIGSNTLTSAGGFKLGVGSFK